MGRMKRAKNMECILFGCPQQISLSLRANFGLFVWMPANQNPSPADALSSCLIKHTGVLKVTYFQTLVSLPQHARLHHILEEQEPRNHHHQYKDDEISKPVSAMAIAWRGMA
jgi:hypothetical protein